MPNSQKSAYGVRQLSDTFVQIADGQSWLREVALRTKCSGSHAKSRLSLAFGFKSRHPGVCQFAFGDGSVRILSESMDHGTYNLLGAKSDGVTIPVHE